MDIKKLTLVVLSLAAVMVASASCFVSEIVTDEEMTRQEGMGTEQSYYGIIMENVRQMLIPTTEDSVVKTYIDELTDEGSLADINYEDNTRGWDPQRHYHRIVPMALCYINPESEYYGSEKLYNKICYP